MQRNIFIGEIAQLLKGNFHLLFGQQLQHYNNESFKLMENMGDFINQAKLLRERNKLDLKQLIEDSPLISQRQNSPQTFQLSRSKKEGFDDSAIFSQDVTPQKIKRLQQPIQESKIFVLGTHKIIRELMPTQRTSEQITLFNRSALQAQLSLRINQQNYEVRAVFSQNSSNRIKLKPFAKTSLSLNIIAGLDCLGKTFNTVVIEGKAGRTRQTAQLQISIDHKKPRLKIFHDQEVQFVNIENKNYMQLKYEISSNQNYSLQLKNQMDRTLTLSLDTTGLGAILPSEDIILGGQESRVVWLRMSERGWRAILIKIKNSEIVYPLSIVL